MHYNDWFLIDAEKIRTDVISSRKASSEVGLIQYSWNEESTDKFKVLLQCKIKQHINLNLK